MKVALCLYGYYNNRVDIKSGEKGYSYIQSKILNSVKSISGELDIFFHSWDISNKGVIFDKYLPVYGVVENQIDFNKISKEHGISENYINGNFNRGNTIYRQCTINASLSFFYSRSQSIHYAIINSNKNNFKYDCIITCRFDLGQRSNWHKGYNVSLMNIDFNLDMNYIYSAMWLQTNAGYADQWFFSNQKNMKKLGTMYDMSLNDYFQVGSEYEKTLTTDWFDSNASDELSNERFTPTKNVVTMKYPKWQMINNHIIHKWHFLKTGLYDISKFIGEKR